MDSTDSVKYRGDMEDKKILKGALTWKIYLDYYQKTSQTIGS